MIPEEPSIFLYLLYIFFYIHICISRHLQKAYQTFAIFIFLCYTYSKR
nr:MAG TPA: hypothetical protein [Caudoviricetes sp.]